MKKSVNDIIDFFKKEEKNLDTILLMTNKCFICDGKKIDIMASIGTSLETLIKEKVLDISDIDFIVETLKERNEKSSNVEEHLKKLSDLLEKTIKELSKDEK